MYPTSIWSPSALIALPPLDEAAWSSAGIRGTNHGAAVAWLGDCARTDGWASIHHAGAAPADLHTLPLPCGGVALRFTDYSFLLARADGRVFPAPFQADGHWPKPAILSRRLHACGAWPQEWRYGCGAGHLAPSFRPFQTVLAPDDEALMITIGQYILAVLHVPDATLTWTTQPVRRDATLSPLGATTSSSSHNPTALQEAVQGAIARLVRANYPIPALPGQSLQHGHVTPIATHLRAHTPPIHSAHARLTLHQDRVFRTIQAIVQPEGTTPPGLAATASAP